MPQRVPLNQRQTYLRGLFKGSDPYKNLTKIRQNAGGDKVERKGNLSRFCKGLTPNIDD